MDNRPIGIFDSGVGGLTALRALRLLLPGENIVYFGDTARVPYGGRSVPELQSLAKSDGDFLLSRGVKAILVACGTVSSNALSCVGDGSVPVLGVLKPSAAEAAGATKNRRLGVLSTEATHKSGAFQRELRAVCPDAEVFSVGTGSLVPLAEAGRVSPDDPEVAEAVGECLSPLLREGIDTLVLGCTHFPLLAPAISAFAGDGVALIDSGAAGARAMAELLRGRDMLGSGSGECSFFVSGDAGSFMRGAALFLGGEFDTAHTTVYYAAPLI